MLKDLPQLIWEKPIPPQPVIFLVNGEDFVAAVKASRPFLQPQGDAKAPGAKTETKAGAQIWLGAHLGVKGSQPPAYRVLSIEVEGQNVRVTYETLKNASSTLDYFCYLVWAPLGELSAGEYTLELYDAAAKKVTATRKSKVVDQSAASGPQDKDEAAKARRIAEIQKEIQALQDKIARLEAEMAKLQPAAKPGPPDLSPDDKLSGGTIGELINQGTGFYLDDGLNAAKPQSSNTFCRSQLCCR